MKKNVRNILLIIGGIIGIVLIVVGAVLGFVVLPNYIEDEIINQVKLERCTEQYNRWEELPFAITFKVHLFNVENPEEVVNGVKPVITERGPYVYKQYNHKTTVHRDVLADTLSYYQYRRYEFDAEASSPLTEEDDITTLNVPMNGVFQLTENYIGGSEELMTLIHGELDGAFPDTPHVFHNVKVKDYLFGGYQFCQDSENNTLCAIIKLIAPEPMEVQEDGSILFSFFRSKHEHHDGYYTVTAGMNVIDDLGFIRKWGGNNQLRDTWVDNSACNEIKGRDSTIYPPFIEEEDEFDIFSTDICRVVTLEYADDGEYQDISGQRRILKRNTLNNDGANECYCIKQTRNIDGALECFPNGFIDLNNCIGAPVILSFPHFLWAEDYTDTVEGLNPNEDSHGTFVLLEPGTGSPLRGAKRVQFNMVIRPIEFLPRTENLSRAMLPLLWVEEGTDLPNNLVQDLKDKYLDNLVIVDAVTWTLIGVGIALLVVCCAVLLYFICYRKK